MEWFGTRIEYALVAAMHLARHSGPDNPVKLDHIVAQTGAPPKYLVHILLRLKEKALVNSKRGPSGGYWLVKPPYMISVAEIVSAVEPESEQRREPSVKDKEAGRAIREAWEQLERKRWQAMREISLKQLLEKTKAAKEAKP